MKVFKAVLNALFPNKCISCGDIIDGEEFLCEYCYEMIDRIDFTKICLKCGLLKKNCECKDRVFHFAGAVAPFKKEGPAQDSMYHYKFKKIYSPSIFFANEMAKMVKSVYNDIAFDGIAYVPMHLKKQRRRGFNQAEDLACLLAERLGLKVYHDLLFAQYTKKAQHNLSPKKRFANVKGKYNYNYKVNGKTVLLVDDIKTTGATLDECAKQLLLAGADNVYCICGLITNKERKRINGN